MDHLAEAYKTVRDATLNNPNITNAEALAALNLVAFEMQERMLADIRNDAMNGLSNTLADIASDRA